MRTILRCAQIIAVAFALGSGGVAAAFDGPEHKEIGDTAAAKVLQDFGDIELGSKVKSSGEIQLTRGGASGTFGDLVGLYGDHRATVNEMMATNDRALGALKREALGKFQGQVDLANALRKEASLDEAKTFLKLAAANEIHFGAAAIQRYNTLHREALTLAASGDPEKLWLAIHNEAFAGHCLSDLFAPGHRFVDRAAAAEDVERALAEQAGEEPWYKRALDVVKGVLGAGKGVTAHKYEHDSWNVGGAWFKNLRGDEWGPANGDSGYRDMPPTQRMKPVEAVEASLRAVLAAYREGKGGAEVDVNTASYHEALRILPAQFRKAVFQPTYFKDLSSLPYFKDKQRTECDQEAFCDFPNGQGQALNGIVGSLSASAASGDGRACEPATAASGEAPQDSESGEKQASAPSCGGPPSGSDDKSGGNTESSGTDTTATASETPPQPQDQGEAPSASLQTEANSSEPAPAQAAPQEESPPAQDQGEAPASSDSGSSE
jgi:hypothetical protein